MDNIFRFDRFEADRDCYQLRSGGSTIKLERIPLELLFLLLEQRGKLVDREQIVDRLWRDDSFLDTERSINTAVRKIRKALGEDARRPRFIETVVGKGYRFIAPPTPQNEVQSPCPEAQPRTPAAVEDPNTEGSEIRMRGFLVETTGGAPVLTCEVGVSNMALGRIALLKLELPGNVILPLKPEDRLLLKLHGVRVSLTAEATQALYAFAISVLQSGLRTRVTDSLHLREESSEPLTAQSARAASVGTGD